MIWEEGAQFNHMGWTIEARLVPEAYDDNARPIVFAKAWCSRDPDPIGFVTMRSFDSFDQMIEFIERREVDKTLWRIKHGKKYRT